MRGEVVGPHPSDKVAVEVPVTKLKPPGVVEGQAPLRRRDAVAYDEEQPVGLTSSQQGVRGGRSILLATERCDRYVHAQMHSSLQNINQTGEA